MVPRLLQAGLWSHYRKGQERNLSPSPAYLRAAAACVRSVAKQEGIDEEFIAAEVAMYEAWAAMVEDD